MADTPEIPIGDATVRAEGAPTPGIERRHLLVFSGPSSWMYQLPASGRVIVGRSETADLRIDDPSVSRQHAVVSLDGDKITIADLGSHNGTFVNDVKIAGEHPLRPDDVVTIHKSTLILHATATVNTPAAVLELAAFRKHLEDEIDRAVRYERSCSVLCFVWPEAVGKRAPIERAVVELLRRIDAATWANESTLYVLVAEASGEEALAIATRIQSTLDATALRVGHATCPADGYDVDDLLASARNAAIGAAPGSVAGTTRAFQTLAIGAVRVIVADPTVVRLYALIERLAPVDLPVLITGETGCGKELAATAIHTMSRRRDKALVSLNCAAIQESLVESELFGHERGAFSGAVASKPGLFEQASGSTLFLDEVGELSLPTQAKLLRVLETHRVTRVGDVREREVDVRIVAATNRDLDAEVAAGRFRQDLYFRLTAATIHLPPLRQRPRELPLLAAAFLDEACRKSGRGPMTISDGAMASLLAHAWPGNVRELKNTMHFIAAAHRESAVSAEHVAERIKPQAKAPVVEAPKELSRFRPIADELRDIEIARMREALEAANGNQTRAASLLSMPIRTFYEKAKLYGLTPKKKKD